MHDPAIQRARRNADTSAERAVTQLLKAGNNDKNFCLPPRVVIGRGCKNQHRGREAFVIKPNRKKVLKWKRG
jgi:hypothetical protein